MILLNTYSTAEIKVRIGKAGTNFIKITKFFLKMSVALKIQPTQCNSYYGVKSWTLKLKAIKRLNSLEMWTYIRMLSIS